MLLRLNSHHDPVSAVCVACMQVDGKGQDLFLIRWEDFGPYWDSWEPRASLNKPPSSYTWQGGKAAIPKKFLRK